MTGLASRGGAFRRGAFGAVIASQTQDSPVPIFTGANLSGVDLTDVCWSHTTCPDGTNSDNDGGACAHNL